MQYSPKFIILETDSGYASITMSKMKENPKFQTQYMLSFDRHHRNILKNRDTDVHNLFNVSDLSMWSNMKIKQAENPKQTQWDEMKGTKERNTYSLSDNYIDGTIWSRLSSRKNASICIESMNDLRGLMKDIIILVHKGIPNLESGRKRIR